MTVFGEMGVQNLDIGFTAPKRHVVWRILRKNWCMHLGGSLSQDPSPPKIAESLCADAEGRKITHVQK